MSTLQAVGLGMCTLDVLVRLKDMPTWEHGTRISGFALEGGGPVGTAMVAVARLGVPCGLIGTCGSDEAGQLKYRTLDRDGLDLSRLVRRPGPENQVVLVFVDEETGERTFAGLRGIGDQALELSEADREYITQAEYLHIQGYHYEASLQAAQWMHAAGKKVVYDGSKTNAPVSAPIIELIRHVDVLICGSGFGAGLTGERDLWRAGEKALDMGPSIVVQTEGVDGSITVTREDEFHIPSFPVEVIDTTGAGDVFHGAYIVGLLQGWDLRTIAFFATAVSAIKCTKLSGRAGIPRFDEVIAFLRERGIAI
jgi:ribokinase